MAQHKKKVARKKPKSSNLVSGIIYTLAVIGSLALGTLFYHQYQQAAEPREELGQDSGYNALPPGSKVVTRSGETIDVPRMRQPGKPAEPEEPAIPSPFDQIDTAEEQAAAERVPVQAPRSGPPPSLEPLERVAWDVAAQVIQSPQKILLYPAADTTIYAEPITMRDANDGLAPELIAQGSESFIFTRYDLRDVRDWTIKKATWRGKLKRGRAAPLTFSTIRAYWTEGKTLANQPPEGGATYYWADDNNYRWRADEASAPYVINGYSRGLSQIVHPEDPDAQLGDWVTYEIDPRLVQALIAGDAFGIAITEEKGQAGIPFVIGSREEDEANYYIDALGGIEDIEPPGTIKDFWVDRHGNLAKRDTVGVVLSWVATGDDDDRGQAFRYDVRYAANADDFNTATRVPVYALPRPMPSGQADKVVIEGLLPDTLYTFFVRAVDEVGHKGEIVRKAFRTGRAMRLPPVAAQTGYERGPITMSRGTVRLEVVDAQTCISPTTGRATVPRPDGESISYVWNHRSKSVYLQAARNETASFQLVVGRKAADFPRLKMKAGSFAGPQRVTLDSPMTFHRVWYSAAQDEARKTWLPDAIIPQSDFITIPMPDNKVERQVAQSLIAQIHIPPDAKPGSYEGHVLIETEAGERETINVFIDVADVTLPSTPSFTIELADQPLMAPLYRKNLKQLTEALPIEQKYFQLAHRYRCTLATIPRTDRGRNIPTFVPPHRGTGKDIALGPWGTWAQHYASLLDGDLFLASPQGPAPATHFIVPLSEGWPTPFADAYQCAGQEVAHPETGQSVFDGTTLQIQLCLSHVYWDAWRTALEEMGKYVGARGWHAPRAHIWLPAKPGDDYVGKAPPWNLSHPRYFDDFTALAQYGTRVNEAAHAWQQGQLVFRVNISRISDLRDRCHGLFDLLSVHDRELAGWSALRARAGAVDEELWLQSPSLPIDGNLLNIQEEGLTYFLQGATGWSIRGVLGRTDDWMRARPRSLFYAGLPQDLDEPLPSLRMHALRQAQQDIELLMMLKEKRRWTLQQLDDFVRRYVPGLGSTRPSSQFAQWHLLRNTTRSLLAR